MSLSRTATFLSDRARGCILAGAIGDAMGGPFEGQPGPLKFREYASWSISDDSQLTLATCESIIQAGEVSPEHIAGRFLHWYRARRITGMGSSTLKALRDLDAGAHHDSRCRFALADRRQRSDSDQAAAVQHPTRRARPAGRGVAEDRPVQPVAQGSRHCRQRRVRGGVVRRACVAAPSVVLLPAVL